MTFENIIFSDEPITRDLAERIEAGAAWLDEVRPDWRDRIDTRTLDLSHPTHCVLGEVFADEVDTDRYWVGPVSGYGVVWEEVHDAAPEYEKANDWMRERGFEHDPDESILYTDLTDAWREYLDD